MTHRNPSRNEFGSDPDVQKSSLLLFSSLCKNVFNIVYAEIVMETTIISKSTYETNVLLLILMSVFI